MKSARWGFITGASFAHAAPLLEAPLRLQHPAVQQQQQQQPEPAAEALVESTNALVLAACSQQVAAL